MKTKLFLAFSFIFINYSFSQTKININLSEKPHVNKIEEVLEKDKYELTLTGDFEAGRYLTYKKEDNITLYELLTPSVAAALAVSSVTTFAYKKIDSFKIKNRSEYKITIQVINEADNKVEREIIIIFKSKNNRKWVTSVGVSGAFLTNKETYRTLKQEDTDKYNVVQDGSNQLLHVIPLMQFSFINIEKDNSFAPTAGIGLDNTSVSVFIGGSYYFGQNVFITGGLALHKQKRLNNLYAEGQELDAAVDESLLNKEYYRVNPFVSLTYRLSTNIFQKN